MADSGNSEMVELVARAMWAERVRHAREVNGIDLEPYDTDFGGRPIAEQNNIIGEASAAIEAMMEPSPSMVKAVIEADHNAQFERGLGLGFVRQAPQLLSDEERKQILTDAERLWAALLRNDLGGYSDGNRPFYILHAFKEVIEKYGRRDVGLTWSKNDLDKLTTT